MAGGAPTRLRGDRPRRLGRPGFPDRGPGTGGDVRRGVPHLVEAMPPPGTAKPRCKGHIVMITEHATPPRLLMLRGEARCRMFELGRDSTTLGHDPDCDIVLHRKTVSRVHAQIVRRRDGYFLEDLGSSGGTRVNGHASVLPVRLKDGDLIEIGDCLFRFSES